MSLRPVALFGTVMAGLAPGGSAFAQQSPAPKPQVLFTNVHNPPDDVAMRGDDGRNTALVM